MPCKTCLFKMDKQVLALQLLCFHPVLQVIPRILPSVSIHLFTKNINNADTFLLSRAVALAKRGSKSDIPEKTSKIKEESTLSSGCPQNCPQNDGESFISPIFIIQNVHIFHGKMEKIYFHLYIHYSIINYREYVY